MRSALTLVVLGVWLSGCAAPVQATRDLPQPQTLEEVNLLLRGKRVTVELADGERIPSVRRAVVTPYDVRFERQGEPHAVPVEDVARIVYVRNRGTKGGMAVGATPGLALLAVGFGVIAASDGEGVGMVVAVVGVSLMGGVLTLVGTAMGGVVGQGVSPGGVVPLYHAPVERYLPQPAQSGERP